LNTVAVFKEGIEVNKKDIARNCWMRKKEE
jgi:hypothetical protein